ncbi:hypothetical protein [Verrucomicrobium spinosum]|uniref:hypothetical protein n=1 Tax=Verrucomicrobium spinosum TaxID=2736 RepID=UPI001C478ABE|nr:hypothetical protein [Verrucomicrobium spinosum]
MRRGRDPGSYGTTLLEDVPEHHWAFLESTLPWYETATDIFVHANLRAHLPLDQQSENVIYWERLIICHPHISGRRMICGHTPQHEGVPLNFATPWGSIPTPTAPAGSPVWMWVPQMAPTGRPISWASSAPENSPR